MLEDEERNTVLNMVLNAKDLDLFKFFTLALMIQVKILTDEMVCLSTSILSLKVDSLLIDAICIVEKHNASLEFKSGVKKIYEFLRHYTNSHLKMIPYLLRLFTIFSSKDEARLFNFLT